MHLKNFLQSHIRYIAVGITPTGTGSASEKTELLNSGIILFLSNNNAIKKKLVSCRWISEGKLRIEISHDALTFEILL